MSACVRVWRHCGLGCFYAPHPFITAVQGDWEPNSCGGVLQQVASCIVAYTNPFVQINITFTSFAGPSQNRMPTSATLNFGAYEVRYLDRE